MSAPALSPIGQAFVVAAFLEAITWSGLLVGMFFKYQTASVDLGLSLVSLFGRAHGLAAHLETPRQAFETHCAAGVASAPQVLRAPLLRAGAEAGAEGAAEGGGRGKAAVPGEGGDGLGAALQAPAGGLQAHFA